VTTLADIVIHQGYARILRFVVKDADNITYDLTGWEFPSNLRSLNTEEPLLNLLAEIDDPLKGKLKLTYPQTETVDLRLELAEANLTAVAPPDSVGLPPLWYGQVLISNFGPSDDNKVIPLTLDYPQTLLSGQFVTDDETGEIVIDDETGEPILVG
jgi:hypothetical protein